MKNIYIIGAGGHAKVVADIILKRKELLNDSIDLVGFLDDNLTENIFNIPVLGKVEKINELKKDKNNYFVIAIGNNKVREKITRDYNCQYITLIHPKSIIGNEVKIDTGTVVMAGVVVNSYSRIGKHSIINTGSIIEHDNEIEDFVHISPKVSLAGNIQIGKNTWVGIGSIVIQGIKIGKETIIGAGSVVVKNINDKVKAYGNPCREIGKT